MPDSDLGPWGPLDLESVLAIFSSASFRWWISGGHALDLHLGCSWRRHDDTDVGVLRHDFGSAAALLPDWDMQIAAAGTLTPWRGEPLDAARDQNNVWCRRATGEPWLLDLTIGEGSAQNWIYRRDPSLQVPWDLAVLHTAAGVPYLAPDLQLLFKSKGLRPKDQIDAEHVIPELNARQRADLSRRLDQDHPWQALLR